MGDFSFTVKVDGDSALEITKASLQDSYNSMVEYLNEYADNSRKFIAVFSTNKQTDIAQLTKMRDAIAFVAKEWYGFDFEPKKVKPAPVKKATKKKVSA